MSSPPTNYGPHGSEEAALQDLVRRLVRGLNPQAVYLFGSRAEGRARPESDFDLAVVLDAQSPDAQMGYDSAYAPLLESGIGCDVVPCTTTEFAAVLEDPLNPWHHSWKRARKLYERS